MLNKFPSLSQTFNAEIPICTGALRSTIVGHDQVTTITKICANDDAQTHTPCSRDPFTLSTLLVYTTPISSFDIPRFCGGIKGICTYITKTALL